MSFAELKARRAARDGRWHARGRDGGEGHGEREGEGGGRGGQDDEGPGAGLAKKEQHEPHTTDTSLDAPPPELRGSQLTLFAAACRGRGLQRAHDAPAAQPGDQLLAVEPHASVLSTAQAEVRCHYCFVKRAGLQRCSGCKRGTAARRASAARGPKRGTATSAQRCSAGVPRRRRPGTRPRTLAPRCAFSRSSCGTAGSTVCRASGGKASHPCSRTAAR